MIKYCYENEKKHVNRSRISDRKFEVLLKYFSIDLNATQITKLTLLSRQTINNYLTAIRLRIANYCQQEFTLLAGQIEVDESYFGARHVKGKCDLGARDKTIVFGITKKRSQSLH